MARCPPPTGLALPPQLGVLADPGFAAPAPAIPAGEESFTDAEQTAAWLAGRLAAAGLTRVEMQRYEADADMWWPDDREVRVLGHDDLGRGSEDVVLGSAVPAPGVQIPGGVLTAPLVYAGDIGDFADVDVRGSVAVRRIRPFSGAFSQRAAIRDGAQELLARGAVGILNCVDQPGNMHVRDFGGCGISFNIGGDDGAFLRDVAERASRVGSEDALRVRLGLDARIHGDLGRYDLLGVPRVQAIHAGPLYHTSADVLESISVAGLERASRFYAFFIDGVAKATRAQIDP